MMLCNRKMPLITSKVLVGSSEFFTRKWNSRHLMFSVNLHPWQVFHCHSDISNLILVLTYWTIPGFETVKKK